MAVILMSSITNAIHSPGAKSGSPGDGADCSSCHSGTPQSASNWITSNIPLTGYVPGASYTITLTGTHTGVALFGFELTAEDSSSAKVGSFTITNSTETRLTNGMHAVTHTANGITPTNNSKSWSFEWTAPAAGSGSVTFYASLNAANGNSVTSGDVIYNTNIAYKQDLSIGIDDKKFDNELFHISPNPVNNILSIEVASIQSYEVKILDLAGKMIISAQFDGGFGTKNINTSTLPKGIYIIKIQNDNRSFSKQFIKI